MQLALTSKATDWLCKLTVQCSPVVIELLSFLVTCSATYNLQAWETYPLLICSKALGCMIWIPSALSQSTRAIEAPRRMASNWSVTETSFYYYTQCMSASLNWTQHASWQNDTHCSKRFNTFACELWHFSTFNYSLDKTVVSQIGSDFTGTISGHAAVTEPEIRNTLGIFNVSNNKGSFNHHSVQLWRWYEC